VGYGGTAIYRYKSDGTYDSSWGSHSFGGAIYSLTYGSDGYLSGGSAANLRRINLTSFTEQVANNGAMAARGITLGADGIVYASGAGKIWTISEASFSGGTPTQLASGLDSSTWGLAYGADANLYVADYSGKIQVVTTNGTLQATWTLPGGSYGVRSGPDGNLYAGTYDQIRVLQISNYTANASGAITTLYSSSDTHGLGGIDLMVTAIPEPGAAVLVVASMLVGACLFRRRKA
jgi:hypothetical protein